jgi:hypothetical protein
LPWHGRSSNWREQEQGSQDAPREEQELGVAEIEFSFDGTLDEQAVLCFYKILQIRDGP